jgi:hypothetical protein
MKPILCRFWKERQSEEWTATIQNTVKDIIRSLNGMSEHSVKELRAKWLEETKRLHLAAENLHEMFHSDMPGDWEVGIMEVLAQYIAYRELIKLVDSRGSSNICKDDPPQRKKGETLEAYKQRLQQYINEL